MDAAAVADVGLVSACHVRHYVVAETAAWHLGVDAEETATPGSVIVAQTSDGQNYIYIYIYIHSYMERSNPFIRTLYHLYITWL